MLSTEFFYNVTHSAWTFLFNLMLYLQEKEFKKLKNLLNFWMPDSKDPLALKIWKKRELNAHAVSCKVTFTCINGRTMVICSCCCWLSNCLGGNCPFQCGIWEIPTKVFWVTQGTFLFCGKKSELQQQETPIVPERKHIAAWRWQKKKKSISVIKKFTAIPFICRGSHLFESFDAGKGFSPALYVFTAYIAEGLLMYEPKQRWRELLESKA